MTHPDPPDCPPTADPCDEIDVDLGEDDGTPDLAGADYVGTYATITDYLRAMLEPEVSPGCAWILEHLDYAAVRRRWERDGRLVIERGRVYQLPRG